MPPPLDLPPAVFAILAGLIEERTGLHHGLDKRDLLAERATARALDRGLDSLLDYYYLLRYDDEEGHELQRLVESLVVQETYFFRELDQLEVAADLLAERAREQGRARAWSAACASGEEPLSLAMLLAERGVLDRVELVASDISARSLDRARQGRFGVRALRGPPPRHVMDPWVTREADRLVVRPELVARIDWRIVNLLAPPPLATLGGFDAIMCRNVLIYFTDETVRRVVDDLAARLVPGGALFAGVSESLLRLGSSLQWAERAGVYFYRTAGGRP